MSKPATETAAPEPAESAPKAKGLWATMNVAAQPPMEADVGPDNEPASSEESSEAEHSVATDGPAKPRGLWSLMQPEAAPAEEVAEESTLEAAATDQTEPVEEAGETYGIAATEQRTEPFAGDGEELEVAPLEELTEEEERQELDVSVGDVASAEAKPREVVSTVPRSRGAVRSLWLGIVAVLISGLALLPEFWLRIPSTLVGFLALMLGLLAHGEIRRSRGRQSGQGLAAAGMIFGAAGMLLGPFVFSELGIVWRQKFGRTRTYNNVHQIGDAMNGYYKTHKQYPPEGTYRQKDNTPLHNWQTMLLPYLDEGSAFDKLDLTKPYNEGNNAEVMKRRIPAFLASGTDDSPLPNGFAVTHFVALSGQIDVEGVGRVSVGVFERNGKLKHTDVTDGLGETLVAGEIAYDFPAWGAPGNYRQIGKGLCKGRAGGFGNSDHTGAMFLMADGSVRFISNKVDPKVLQALSTRNGRETVDMNSLP